MEVLLVGGPCVLFVPFVALAFIVALPLWPVAIVVVGLAWCIARLGAFAGVWSTRWSARLALAFLVTLKPWIWFDHADVRAARRARLGLADGLSDPNASSD